MNDLNSLEKRVASWRPRRPSPTLKGRIFGESAAPEPESISGVWEWLYQGRHLGMAAAGFTILLTAAVLIVGGRQPGLASTGVPVIAVAGLSNQSFMAYASVEHSAHNTWSAPILGWTNEAASRSSTPLFDGLNTNDSLRKL